MIFIAAEFLGLGSAFVFSESFSPWELGVFLEMTAPHVYEELVCEVSSKFKYCVWLQIE